MKEKGFTRDIAKYLDLVYSEERDLIMLGKDYTPRHPSFADLAISAKQFIKCCEMIPDWNFEQGKGLTIKQYLKLAKRFPDLLFEGYIITEFRPDERLDIDAVYIPRTKWRYRRLIKRLTKKLPDEVNYHIFFTRLWWD